MTIGRKFTGLKCPHFYKIIQFRLYFFKNNVFNIIFKGFIFSHFFFLCFKMIFLKDIGDIKIKRTKSLQLIRSR